MQPGKHSPKNATRKTQPEKCSPDTSAHKGASMPEYWYNVNTHEIEEDAMSDWSQLIGPYKTREEAQHALEKVKARNEAWDKDEDD
jgi:hypothetical protein